MGDSKRPGVWPGVAGLTLLAAGLLFGYLLPVGQYCEGTFLAQTWAHAEDLARAQGMTLTTHYEAACVAAAGMQSHLWWSLIVLGSGLTIFGALWRFLPLAVPLRQRLLPGLITLWSGTCLLAVGIVGGWTLPAGANCSGPFGNQEPAIIASYNSGSSAILDQCRSLASVERPLWWALIALAVIVMIVGIVFALISILASRMPTPARAAYPAMHPWPPQPPMVPMRAFPGVAAELAHLAYLRDQGVLTHEEFEAQKAKLLA